MVDRSELAARVRRMALDQPETLGDGDCEALRDGWWGQPTNTVTSFAYVVAGGWLGARLRRLRPGQRPAAGAYAALAAVAGIGSVAYHGPQFDGAQLLHDAPIVGLFGLGAAVPLWRRATGRAPLPGWSTRTGVAMAVTGTVGLAAYAGGRSTSPLCEPTSLVQLHGLWHVATATLMALWGTVLWVPEEPARVDPDDRDPDHERADA
jgi:hypothetical protein